ncbi:hypothetical protein [Methylocystis sp. Sn-Cys]|uniref:hypothetical protein n=1 Tax=Methylocystis sp. Sn-Cys TaxID=1701263 RepID=UPI001924B47B|nr:hypothetical protein [Methylocystis sp. Sn-Cys]MBL1257718.1 hypothetical protein [Methylocystis sp. Sn-Cys]
MTDLTPASFEAGALMADPPPVTPNWLRAASLSGVLAAHGAVAWLLLAVAVPTISNLDSISMDLVPQGDFFESQQVTAAEEQPPPLEEVAQPDLPLPPPVVMSPDAPPLPVKKEVVEKKKKKVAERKPEVDHADKRREAQARRRMGAPEGHSETPAMSQSDYKAMLAATIRQHTPATSSAGEGSASVAFHVTAGGGIAGISASGSTPAHAALARQIMSSVHAPPPPGGGFFASQNFHFH